MLALKTWLEQRLARVSGKSAIAEAIRYGFNHWHGLTRFLEDGRIELDTNIVERCLRPMVLNRKNALFAGHDQGAENWAASLRLSRPANSTASIRKPTSPTCSQSSSISGRPIASTNSSPGPGQRSSDPPIASRRSRACKSGSRSLPRKIKPSEPWDRRTAYRFAGGVPIHPGPLNIEWRIVNSGKSDAVIYDNKTTPVLMTGSGRLPDTPTYMNITRSLKGMKIVPGIPFPGATVTDMSLTQEQVDLIKAGTSRLFYYGYIKYGLDKEFAFISVYEPRVGYFVRDEDEYPTYSRAE